MSFDRRSGRDQSPQDGPLQGRPVQGWVAGGHLRQGAWLASLVLAVMAGLAVMAPGAAQAQSRFEGRWSGPWNDPATREDGNLGLGIAFDGDLRGRLDNPGRGTTGEITGRISESGRVDGTYVLDDRSAYNGRGAYRTYRVSGSLEPRGPLGDELYGGIAFFDGPTRVGGAILNLGCAGGLCRRHRP